MAGIAGVLDLRSELEPSGPLVTRMTDVLAHRGPDGDGVVSDGPAALAWRTLARADEPVAVDGPLRLVLDGDVVNCPELAAELRTLGRRVDGSAQAETVLAAWAEWGPECLGHLNGGFALAIWDGRSRRLFCARDRFGLKPLYYTMAAGRFRFASELKALLTDGDVPRVPNEARLLDYLAWGMADHTPETMLAGILQVPLGAYVVAGAERGVEGVTQWYDLGPAPATGPPPQRVRELLGDAIALRLRGDGVLGMTLSGGVDSASVLATAVRLRRAAGEELPLAVVARAADPLIDEWPYAELLLRRDGIPSVQLLPDEQRLVADFDTFAWSLDEPCHSPTVYGHWRVMQAAREAGVDIVLEGQAGEHFGGLGYWYPQLFYDMLRRGRVAPALRELVARRRVQGVPMSRSLLDLGKLLLPRRVRAAHASPPAWLRPGLAIEPAPLPRRGLLPQQIYQLLVAPMPLRGREIDRDASTFGLRERSPFLDHRVIEYALSLPPETLHRDGQGKAPLLAAMRGVVPDEILDRPVKQGFTVDQTQWVRGAFGDAVERTFRSEAAADRPYWNATAVLRLLDDCRAGRGSTKELWRAYSAERWLELIVDPTRAVAPALV